MCIPGRQWSAPSTLSQMTPAGGPHLTLAPSCQHPHTSALTPAPSHWHPHTSTLMPAPSRQHPHTSTLTPALSYRTLTPASSQSTLTPALSHQHPHTSTLTSACLSHAVCCQMQSVSVLLQKSSTSFPHSRYTEQPPLYKHSQLSFVSPLPSLPTPPVLHRLPLPIPCTPAAHPLSHTRPTPHLVGADERVDLEVVTNYLCKLSLASGRNQCTSGSGGA